MASTLFPGATPDALDLMIARGPGKVDFSPLGDAFSAYQQGVKFRNAQDLLAARKSSAVVKDDGTPDYGATALNLLRAGDQQGAAQIANIAAQQARTNLAGSEFAFRKQDVQRQQGNTDRSFGLQQQQFNELVRQHNLAGEKPITVPYGSSLVSRTGEDIRPGSTSFMLDPQTIDQMARQARAGDTSVFTNLGRGAQGAQNVVAVRKRLAEINAEEGESGTEQANRQAEFFGTKAGQRTLGTKTANIEMAATEFNQVLPVVVNASNAVNRTQYPDLNRIIQAYQEHTGDPNIVRFGQGVNTLVNLYARAISPTGVSTVSDKDHARLLLNRAWSQGQFGAAVGMMQQEINAALNSPGKVRDDMRNRFMGGQSGASTSPPRTKADIQQSIANAKAAIANGKDRNVVLQILRNNGIPIPAGL